MPQPCARILAALPVQAYAANYSGHARIDRLLFAADKSAGSPLELEALKLAADALKQVLLCGLPLAVACALCACMRGAAVRPQVGRCLASPEGAMTGTSPQWTGPQWTRLHSHHALLALWPPGPSSGWLQTENTQRYVEVVERIRERARDEYAIDKWVQAAPRYLPLFGPSE